MDRRKFLKVAGTSALLAAIPHAALAHHRPGHTKGPQPQPEPQLDGPGGISLGCHTGNIQYNVPISEMDQYASNTGTVPRIILVHQDWYWGGSYVPFAASGINSIYSRWPLPNTVIMTTWSQSNGVPSLSSIAAGQHDAYIRQFATDVKAFGKRILIRPNAEMNGDWFGFGGQPAAFIDFWRRTVDIFRSVGVPNAEFVWCPNVTYRGTNYPIVPYYPGNDYVDWVGLDGYNYAASRSTAWQEFVDIFAYDLDNTMGQYPKKLIICETGCHPEVGDKGAWFWNMRQALAANRFPQVEGVVYYDHNMDGASWAIDAPQWALEAYKDMAQDGRFQVNLGAP
jgi:mannan endo-1,4-beta-mannosidase